MRWSVVAFGAVGCLALGAYFGGACSAQHRVAAQSGGGACVGSPIVDGLKRLANLGHAGLGSGGARVEKAQRVQDAEKPPGAGTRWTPLKRTSP